MITLKCDGYNYDGVHLSPCQENTFCYDTDMKISTRSIDSFLANPPKDVAVIVLFGPNRGMIDDYTDRLSQTWRAQLGMSGGDSLVSVNTDSLRKDPTGFMDPFRSVSMFHTGGTLYVVRKPPPVFPDLLTELESILAPKDGHPPSEDRILVAADNLSKSSKLRKLAESKAHWIAAVACYDESPDQLMRFAKECAQMPDIAKQLEHEAAISLLDRVGDDRPSIRSRISQLGLYVGDRPTITRADVEALLQPSQETDVAPLIEAYLMQRPDQIALYWQRMAQIDTTEIISIVRILGYKLWYLRQGVVKSQSMPANQVPKAMRPPVFFKEEAAFKAQLKMWHLGRIDKVLRTLLSIESAAKTTHGNARALLQQALFS